MTKEDFSRWISNPNTDGLFVSAFEGLNPHIRVSDANKPYKMHGLIADYDVTITDKELREGLIQHSKAGLRPAYAHRTFSGRGRVIWLFEEPLMLCEKLTEPFLKILRNELGVTKLFGGLDDTILKPSQYYHWMPPAIEFSNDRISNTSLFYWIGRAIDATRKYRGEDGPEIPLDKVYEAIEEKYPSRWVGPFEKGRRGLCFWDPDSTNLTSAIVTETGMRAFSQPRPFYFWSELLGPQWVRQFEEDRLGKPLQCFYYDGRYYWSKDAGNIWRSSLKDDTRHKIADNYGLSLAPNARGSLSEVDTVLLRIRETKAVDKAYPVLYSAKDTARIGPELVLNISRLKPVQPVDRPAIWGEGFPWLAKFLDELLEPQESSQYLYAWMHRFYKGAIEYNLPQGQAIFIAGGVGRGKSLFSNVIMGELMGGVATASDFLLCETSWNAELLHVPIWVVDDAKATTSYEMHAKWTAMVKKSVANTRHPYNAKFRDTATVDWKGRVICTLNDDPESIRQIPHTDGSILDKIMLFKTSDATPEFLSNDAQEALIRAELPYFARWLLDYEIPKELIGNKRFGIKSYHHPSLLEESRMMSRANTFHEIVLIFRTEYKRAHSEKTAWTGTSIQFLQELTNTGSIKELVRPYANSADTIGRRLASLVPLGYVRQTPRRGNQRGWMIDLPDLDL
jgi:hypothetical protein